MLELVISLPGWLVTGKTPVGSGKIVSLEARSCYEAMTALGIF